LKEYPVFAYAFLMAGLLAGGAAPTPAATVTAESAKAPPEPLGSAKVSLLLLKASAERLNNGVLFQCETRIDNATGKNLTVKSCFFSALDGLELVITDKEGKTLVQWGQAWHQSPFSATPRDFLLKPGSTSATLMFPVGKVLPRDIKTVKVRLVGTLHGSEFSRILSTDTIEIEIRDVA
jgi:hypothetical protein